MTEHFRWNMSLTLQSLLFSISLLFFRFPLLFWGVFPFFSKDFRGSSKRKTLAFCRCFPCFFFPKKARVGGSGVILGLENHPDWNFDAQVLWTFSASGEGLNQKSRSNISFPDWKLEAPWWRMLATCIYLSPMFLSANSDSRWRHPPSWRIGTLPKEMTGGAGLGRTRRGSYSPKRRVSAFYVPSRQPLLRTPSKNPS